MFLAKNIECFITIVKEGNMKRAAQALYMTQSPVSRQIKTLENRLGYHLFDRKTSNLLLTEKGQILYNELIPFCEKITALEKTLHKKEPFNKIESISIGMENVTPETIAIFLEKCHDRHFIFSECNPENALNYLLERKVKFLISQRILTEAMIEKKELFESDILLIRTSVNNESKNITPTFIIPRNGLSNECISLISESLICQNKISNIFVIDDLSRYSHFIIKNKMTIVTTVDAFKHLKKHRFTSRFFSTTKTVMKIKTYLYFLCEHHDLTTIITSNFN